jgi:hypothetical protein
MHPPGIIIVHIFMNLPYFIELIRVFFSQKKLTDLLQVSENFQGAAMIVW